MKAERLEHDKRKAYKALKQWINAWSKDHGGITPTKVEIKAESGRVWKDFTNVCVYKCVICII